MLSRESFSSRIVVEASGPITLAILGEKWPAQETLRLLENDSRIRLIMIPLHDFQGNGHSLNQIDILVILDPCLWDGRESISHVMNMIHRSANRENFRVFWVLSNNNPNFDAVRAFENGVDECLFYPFRPREFLARAKASLRRIPVKSNRLRHGNQTSSASSNAEELILDRESFEVFLDSTPIRLTLSEFRILECLTARPQQVFSREQLVSSIHPGEADAFDKESGFRNIDVHIRSLRKKLGPWSKNIQTVRGLGYCYKTGN